MEDPAPSDKKSKTNWLTNLFSGTPEEPQIFKPIAFTGGLSGIIALALYSASVSTAPGLSVFGVGLCISGASTLAGSLAGFIFAIPRSGLKNSPSPADSQSYVPNTNLEDISDWLTKILVGVGLVQIGRAGGAARSLIASMGSAIGGTAQARVMAAGLTTLFLSWGFILCYLWTSTRVKQVLRLTERVKKLEEQAGLKDKESGTETDGYTHS